MILCLLGLHDWDTGPGPQWIVGIQTRECSRCEKVQRRMGIAPWRTVK